MKKTSLLGVKLAFTFLLVIVITLLRAAGTPAMFNSILMMSILFAIWRYKPQEDKPKDENSAMNNQDKHELDKS